MNFYLYNEPQESGHSKPIRPASAGESRFHSHYRRMHKKRAITAPRRHGNGPFLPKQIKLYKLSFAAFLHEPWRSETDFAGKSSGSWIITFAVFPAGRPVTLLRPFPIYSGGTAWDLHPTSLLNPDTRRAKGYLRVHYSTISVSFQAAVTLNPTTLGRLNKRYLQR